MNGVQKLNLVEERQARRTKLMKALLLTLGRITVSEFNEMFKDADEATVMRYLRIVQAEIKQGVRIYL
jgi:hypothetical protein